MKDYQKKFALTLSETGALFFKDGLILKDGRPTPYFVNMAMFKTGRLSFELGSFFAGMMIHNGIAEKTDIILGPSYKGSSIALATAIALYKEHGIDIPFEYDRKEAKIHGEASSVGSMFVNGTFFDGCRVFVVDDVATSMGTKYELLEKVANESTRQGMSINIIGIGIGIDREQTTAVYDNSGSPVPGCRGENAISDFVLKSGVPVIAVSGIRAVIEYLFEKRIPVTINGKKEPLSEHVKAGFDDYLKTYGTI